MRIAFRLFSAILLVLLLLGKQGTPLVYAASYVVNSLGDTIANDGFCTLREAIQEANNGADTDCPGSPSAGDDTITFSVSGTITLGSTLSIAGGSGKLTIDGAGQSITISGNNTLRVMNVQSGADLTLRSLTIRDGKSSSGGGIYNLGVLKLENCFVTNNAAYVTSSSSDPVYASGGGLYNEGQAHIEDSTFSYNLASSLNAGGSAYAYGGGIYSNGELRIVDSTFLENKTSGTSNPGNRFLLSGVGAGGSIYVESGFFQVSRSRFQKNSAFSRGSSTLLGSSRAVSSGGAITARTGVIEDSIFEENGAYGVETGYIDPRPIPVPGYGAAIAAAGTVEIRRSIFSNNQVGQPVGANGGGVAASGVVSITHSTFQDNYGFYGGGIYHSSGTLILANSTLYSNRASRGGGIYFMGSLVGTPISLINSTLYQNEATETARGGGIYQEYSNGTLRLINTIVAESINGDCVAPSATGENNLIKDTTYSCGLINGVDGNIIGSDPNLGALTGSPAYFPLNPGSPAIDAGDNATCAAAPVNNESQNGVTRPQDGDGNGTAVCDIGSYEKPGLVAPVVVTHNLQSSYTGIGPASFSVTFNVPVYDPTGSSDLDDVTNPANYLLIEKGANGVSDTLSCAGGLAGDDSQQAVASVSYDSSTYTATVTLTGGLPAGKYRLFVCGTTSIVSDAANPSDRIPLENGRDFIFDFEVVPSPPPPSSSPSALPATGFPQGRVTVLDKPATAYSDTGILLEIPSLKIKAPIVGIPKSDSTWDVSWLGNSVGWLEGSAFPTWKGNTVLTGHVWNADNTPGVFNQIKTLKYGDRIYIHAFGQTYIYEVRENTWLWGDTRVDKVFKHEEVDWVTLLTCEGYNPLKGNYLFRRIVRAVLVDIK